MSSTVMGVIEKIEENLNGKLGPKFQELMETQGGLYVVFGKNNKKFAGVFNGMSFVEACSKGYDVLESVWKI